MNLFVVKNLQLQVNLQLGLDYHQGYIAKLSPKPQLKPNWGLRLALLSVYPATPTPSPTCESMIQTQIDLDLKSKTVGHNG